MKKKTKVKNKQQKQLKQKQKQKQSVVVNIDNSRKTIARKKPDENKQQQPKAPSVIPQPIYIPQYASQPFAQERPPFRQEPVSNTPAFNPNPPVYNPPPLVPQQINPVSSSASTLSSISSSSSSRNYGGNGDDDISVVSLFSNTYPVPAYGSGYASYNSNNYTPERGASLVNSNDNFMTAKRPESEERSFNFMGESSMESRRFIPPPPPPSRSLTATTNQDEILMSNDRNIDYSSGLMREEEYRIPSALEKEIRPLNKHTPSPFDDAIDDYPMLVNELGGISAPFSPENSTNVNVHNSGNARRIRQFAQTSDRCVAMTQAGNQCQNRHQPNSMFCGIHRRFALIPDEYTMGSKKLD